MSQVNNSKNGARQNLQSVTTKGNTTDKGIVLISPTSNVTMDTIQGIFLINTEGLVPNSQRYLALQEFWGATNENVVQVGSQILGLGDGSKLATVFVNDATTGVAIEMNSIGEIIFSKGLTPNDKQTFLEQNNQTLPISKFKLPIATQINEVLAKQSSVNTSFTSLDGKTVTITNGIITSVL